MALHNLGKIRPKAGRHFNTKVPLIATYDLHDRGYGYQRIADLLGTNKGVVVDRLAEISQKELGPVFERLFEQDRGMRYLLDVFLRQVSGGKEGVGISLPLTTPLNEHNSPENGDVVSDYPVKNLGSKGVLASSRLEERQAVVREVLAAPVEAPKPWRIDSRFPVVDGNSPALGGGKRGPATEEKQK